MAKKPPPQLLLPDLAMPVLDGYATLLALRQDPALAHIPALAVTALAMRADEERALQAGFAAVVNKPIDVEHLQSVVREMLAHSSR
ncbi:MAG: response regulator [Myxococcales bacterium]|nr:response regulator [Myxococcales bacterium]